MTGLKITFHSALAGASIFEGDLLSPGIRKSHKSFLKISPFGDLLYLVTFRAVFFTSMKNES